MRWLGVLALLLAQPAGWKPPAVRILDEGAQQGYASTVNCVGAGISCSVGASVATVTVTGGGGGSATPGGSSGNVQINSAGAFGAYTGTTCTYAVKSLDASGAATCTAAPSIPADVSGASYWTRVAESGLSNETALGTLGTGLILNTTTTGVPTIYGGTSCPYAIASLNASGTAACQPAPTIPADVSAAHYVTTQAEAGLSAEAVLPTCTGTDKLTFNGTTISCATDQTGSGAPTTATYITQTPDATLSAEQALSSLATGILKNTTITGVLSIAASGTDYAPATSGSSILKGNGAGGFSNAVAGTDYVGTASGCVTLGTATGATTTVGPVTWTGTYGTLIIEYIVAGYNGGTPVGRILMGSAAISTTALTNGNSMSEGIAGTLTNALSIPGAPLAVTLSAIGRCGTMTVRGASGALKSYEIIGGNGNLSVSAARTLFRSAGSFSDLGTNLPIQRAQLTVYDTLVATAASAQTFTTGTRITVIGCP